jgi:hypothetical protein
MNKYIILLILSLSINIFLSYKVFDLGVTVTYMQEEQNTNRRQFSDIEKIFPNLVHDLSKSRILDAGKKSNLMVIDKQEEGIYIGSIYFQYSKNGLLKINFDNDKIYN